MGLEGQGGGGGGGGGGVAGLAFGEGTVTTTETTASAAYTDLATVGPTVTVTVGPTGVAIVFLGAGQSNTGAANNNFMAAALSGANTVAAADAKSLIGQGSPALEVSYSTFFTGLTPGSTTFTAKYRVGGGTGTWNFRTLIVITF